MAQREASIILNKAFESLSADAGVNFKACQTYFLYQFERVKFFRNQALQYCVLQIRHQIFSLYVTNVRAHKMNKHSLARQLNSFEILFHKCIYIMEFWEKNEEPKTTYTAHFYWNTLK